MEILGKLFGSDKRVRILRLFLFNPHQAFGIADIMERAKVDKRSVKRELATLKNINLIKRKRFFRSIEKKKGKKVVTKRRKEVGVALDSEFPYLVALQNILINTVLLRNDKIIEQLNKVGRLKLIIIAGVFIQDSDSRVDILIVGDNLKNRELTTVIKQFEAEIGKELHYAAFETSEFQYRLGMYDKLVRDILDFPHKKILDRIGLLDEIKA